MDTGHVATQWGHTTDLSHFGKLPLLSGGGRSVPGAYVPGPAGGSPRPVECGEHPLARRSSEALDLKVFPRGWSLSAFRAM